MLAHYKYIFVYSYIVYFYCFNLILKVTLLPPLGSLELDPFFSVVTCPNCEPRVLT